MCVLLNALNSRLCGTLMGESRCPPVTCEPLRVAGPNLLNGLVQHILGQQLLHDAVHQA